MAKRARLGFLLAVTFLVFATAIMIAVRVEEEAGPEGELAIAFGEGSLHINDAGRSHGGFEYAAEYKVVVSQTCNGTVFTGHIAGLVFTLDVGLGDALMVHELQLRLSCSQTRDEITLSGSGTEIILVKVKVDRVWDHEWDGYYIASWGQDAPDEEIRGEISPEIFGLPSNYYVELRLDASLINT